MENKDVPYIVHEGMLARQERTIRRLWILCIVIFFALVGTNAGWIWYESQFEEVVITQEAETDPFSNISLRSVGIGDMNGTREADDPSSGQEGQ